MAGMEDLWSLGPPPGGYSFDPALAGLPPGFQPAANLTNQALKGNFGVSPRETVHGKGNGAWFRMDNPQEFGPGLAPLDFGNYGQPQLPPANQAQAKNPYVGGLLGNADILEGIAYRNRQAASLPHSVQNQTMLYGSPLVYSEDVPGHQFDYRGNLLNQGMNPSRQSFVDLYNRSQEARGQQMPGEAGAVQPYGPEYMAPPDVSPAEASRRTQNAFDFMRDLHLSMNPATAPFYAAGTAAHLASQVPGQLGEGDYRSAGLTAGSAALAALGAVPGAGAARTAAREAAPVTPAPAWVDAPAGMSRDQALEMGGRVKLDAQGQPVTVPTVQNMGNMTYTYHMPQWEIPAAGMGTSSPGLIGGPLAPSVPSARTIEPRPLFSREGGGTPAQGADIAKRIEDYQKTVRFDKKGNQIVPQEQPDTVLGMFLGPGAHPLSDKLQQAGQKMEAAGMKPGEIWRRTAAMSQEQGTGGPGGLMGVFKAPDKTWRTEVDDSQASVNIRDRPSTLGGALQHPTLYGYAPGLESTGIGYNVRPGYSGTFAPGPGSDPGFISVTPEGGSTVHEAQHALQHYSGVEGGWNSQAAVPRGNPKIEDLLQAQTQAQYNKYPEFGKGTAQKSAARMLPDLIYKRSAGEIEARTAADRFPMTPAQRIAMPPFEQWPVPAGSQLIGLRSQYPDASAKLVKSPPSQEPLAVQQQRASDSRHSLYQNPSAKQYGDTLHSLITNRTVDPNVRKYLWELHQYAFRPNDFGHEYTNAQMQAYMNLTGGKVGKSVPIADVQKEYLSVSKERETEKQQGSNLFKGGTAHYVKGNESDLRPLTTHFYGYGREVGEKFPGVPNKAAPWLIDPVKNTVSFSPYIPKLTGN
jgi:hypothetical protein